MAQNSFGKRVVRLLASGSAHRLRTGLTLAAHWKPPSLLRLDVRLGGGPTVVNEFLATDLVDHLHVVLLPIAIGRGVRLWDGLEGLHDRFNVETVALPSGASHLFFARR